MPKAPCNGLEIEYERRLPATGGESAPALVFIMGLGAQLVGWDDDFIEGFVRRGYQTLRFDNRDIGLSTRFKEPPLGALMPAIMQSLSGQARGGGRPAQVPYRLDDMADDTAALLDALGIRRAHVVGASMGGMIAQLMALRHPHRLLSLTSIMSSNAEPGLPAPQPQAMAALFSPLGRTPEDIVEGLVRVFRIIGSPPPLFDEDRVRARVRRAVERSLNPAGMARQFLAILAAGSRREALGGLQLPSLVIHGEQDPLVPLECGRATAAAIPGARLLTLPGMGHDLPMALWPTITDAICEVVERGERSGGHTGSDRIAR
jgi:pimeloyl-ACP methyl ester carboxylesterase